MDGKVYNSCLLNGLCIVSLWSPLTNSPSCLTNSSLAKALTRTHNFAAISHCTSFQILQWHQLHLKVRININLLHCSVLWKKNIFWSLSFRAVLVDQQQYLTPRTGHAYHKNKNLKAIPFLCYPYLFISNVKLCIENSSLTWGLQKKKEEITQVLKWLKIKTKLVKRITLLMLFGSMLRK